MAAADARAAFPVRVAPDAIKATPTTATDTTAAREHVDII